MPEISKPAKNAADELHTYGMLRFYEKRIQQAIDEATAAEEKRADDLEYLLGCVACHATGGLLSQVYEKEVYYKHIDDYVNKLVEDSVNEAVAAKDAEIAKLIAALKKYGRHKRDCKIKPDLPIFRALCPKGEEFIPRPCTCGFDEVINGKE